MFCCSNVRKKDFLRDARPYRPMEGVVRSCAFSLAALLLPGMVRIGRDGNIMTTLMTKINVKVKVNCKVKMDAC